LLHFVQQIFLHRPRSLDPQNVVRIHRPLGQTISSSHAVALVHAQVLARRHLVKLRRLRLVNGIHTVVRLHQRLHEDLALAALDLAEPHHAVDLRNSRRILRPARLEQLRNSRQTARDVARLVRLAADLRENGTRGDPRAILHDELSAHRHHEVAQPLLLPALLLHDLDVRVELLLTILDHDALPQTGELIELLTQRLFLDEIDEPDRSLDVRDDRRGIRIPREHHSVLLDLRAIVHHEERAQRYLEARDHGGVLVIARANDDVALVRGDDALSLGVGHEHQPLAILDRPRDLRLPRRLLRDTRRGAADVERPKGELRPRLADRLRGQNAYRLAEIDHRHRREISAVAHLAEPALRLAGENGANAHRLDSRILDRARRLL